MRIFVKDEYVDFEAPIQMTEEQRKKFVLFLKEEFADLEIQENVNEKTKEMGEREVTTKKWTAEELSLLMSPASNEELAAETERSVMSIKMERGHFVPEFMVWAKRKGYSLPVKIEAIKEFLEQRYEK